MKKSFTTELPASTPWCGGPAPPLRPLASHHAARRTPARAAHRDGLQLAGGSCRPGAVSRRGCVACSYARDGPRLSARDAATGTGAAGKPLGLIVCPPTAAARASARHAQLRGSRRGDTCPLPVSRRRTNQRHPAQAQALKSSKARRNGGSGARHMVRYVSGKGPA
jgi:hypothetical protein